MKRQTKKNTRGAASISKPKRKGSQGNSPKTNANRSLRSGTKPIEIDWRAFDDGKHADRFEDMAVDLFAEEFGEAAFTPNARRTGKDGGVDGFYNGTIDKVAGPWKIAVAVRQDFTAAKKKVKQENALARKAKQRALFFITSYDATAVETAELTKLARAGLKGGCVWARAKLDRVLRDHAWIRQVYFGHQLVPGLVPVGHPSELDDPGQPDLELVGRTNERDTFRAFVEGTARILVVVAAGGSGKTRFLRALPELSWGTRPRRSVWLRRPGQGTLDDAFLNGLPARKPILIVLDDAAQSPADVSELARLATDPSTVDVKLVLSIRTVDREAIKRALARIRESIAWSELAELPVSDAARIAKLECPSLSAGDATRLARAFGSNLFLLRAAAQQVRRGEQPDAVVNDEHIRRLVATRLIDEALRHLSGLANQGETLRVLSECALNAPLRFEETTQKEELAALYHAGVLRRVGNTLRFRRDVEGDLLLAYLVEQPAQRAIIERLFAVQLQASDLQRQIRNLSAAGRGYAATMIRELVQRWNAGAGANAERIRLLPYCAEAAPEQVAEITIGAAHGRRLSANDVASIAYALGRSDAARGLRLVWELAALDVTFEVNNVVGRLLNPCFHGPDELKACCLLFEVWLDGGIVGRRDEMLGVGVSALFTTVATWDSYDGASFTLHEQPLPASRELLAIRRTATRLLGKMLSHPEASIRRRAAAILDCHGAPHIGRVTIRGFSTAASDEFQSLLPIVESRLVSETEADIVATIYMSLATRWAIGWPGSVAAGQLLLGRKIEPVVKAFHYSSLGEWFYDFDDAYQSAPKKERWSWWIRHPFPRSNAECARLVSDLCARHTTADQVAVCVSAIAQANRPDWIIDEWCRREPVLLEQAVGLITDERARRVVENALEGERYRIDPSRVLVDLQSLPQPASLDDVSLLLGRATFNDVTLAIEVGRWLADQEDVAVRGRGLERIQHRDDSDPGECLDILERALRDGDWGHHWDMILYVLDKPGRRQLLDQRPILCQRIEERFLVGKAWTGDDWHETRVLNALYGNNHERLLDLLGRLVAAGTFGAVQEVGHLLGPLLLDPATFRRVVDRLIVWARDLGERGLDTVESVLLAAPLDEVELPDDAELPDEAELQDEMMTTALELMQSDDPQARGVALLLLIDLKPTPQICATLARIAADPNDVIQARAVSALWSYRWPRRGWSRSIGEPPKKLSDLAGVLREARQLLSGDARTLVVEMLASVEETLTGYALSDEEVLLPR